jgi:hypothetical protein
LVVALDGAKPAAFYQQVMQGIRGLPGVEALSRGEPPPIFVNEGSVATEEMQLRRRIFLVTQHDPAPWL